MYCSLYLPAFQVGLDKGAADLGVWHGQFQVGELDRIPVFDYLCIGIRQAKAAFLLEIQSAQAKGKRIVGQDMQLGIQSQFRDMKVSRIEMVWRFLFPLLVEPERGVPDMNASDGNVGQGLLLVIATAEGIYDVLEIRETVGMFLIKRGVCSEQERVVDVDVAIAQEWEDGHPCSGTGNGQHGLVLTVPYMDVIDDEFAGEPQLYTTYADARSDLLGED